MVVLWAPQCNPMSPHLCTRQSLFLEAKMHLSFAINDPLLFIDFSNWKYVVKRQYLTPGIGKKIKMQLRFGINLN